MRPSPRSTAALILIGGALAASGCGDGTTSDSTAPTSTTSPATASTTGSSCPDIPVPGHLARTVRVDGVTCAVAITVANDAEGRGRAAYSSSGLSCAPSDAPEGDTDYVCTAGDRRLTFRYGAR